MSSNDEDIRVEVQHLRLQIERLERQMVMAGNVFRMLDHEMKEFAPKFRDEFIDHLRTIYWGVRDDDEDGAALLRQIADDVTVPPRPL